MLKKSVTLRDLKEATGLSHNDLVDIELKCLFPGCTCPPMPYHNAGDERTRGTYLEMCHGQAKCFMGTLQYYNLYMGCELHNRMDGEAYLMDFFFVLQTFHKMSLEEIHTLSAALDL